MDVQTAKLELINWLVNLKDEAVISTLQSIKNSKQDSIDSFIDSNNDVQQLLDNRLEENAADFIDARSSLKKLRHQHGI
ncbi:hypothetical protein F0365_07500 [Nonlabens sp. Ci31]|jgi:hypothetical protein|uniref:hypothetical protein n=1 Tax=Nonlabens sp. Ci31 TaxID=2608253 RepID=UPI0014649D22|nr:hypothetical protein [Nonlabens sp. Ci31]QJP34261.1 hypothetical protein F0365_07500 [Nonlabens sp. Ci31]